MRTQSAAAGSSFVHRRSSPATQPHAIPAVATSLTTARLASLCVRAVVAEAISSQLAIPWAARGRHNAVARRCGDDYIAADPVVAGGARGSQVEAQEAIGAAGDAPLGRIDIDERHDGRGNSRNLPRGEMDFVG
jgi:hypothetical protein